MILDKVHNARFYSTEQVTNKFIINTNYLTLLSENHSILMGPRGCGKTTLLKMLTPKARHMYGGNLPKVNYFGIYIPADTQWLKQNELLKKIITNETKIKPIIKCLVNCNIISACLNGIYEILSVHIKTEDVFNYENKIATEIIKNIIKISNIPASFNHIKIQLDNIISDLNEEINKVIYKVKEIDDIYISDFGYKDYINIVKLIYDIFTNITNNIEHLEKKKWALCFDELEQAPEWIVEEIIKSYFRSTYQEFYIKITTTPILFSNTDINSSNPQQGHDYNIIRCWVHNNKSKEDWLRFAKELISKNYHHKKVDQILSKHDYALGIYESEPEKHNNIDFKVPDFYKKSIMYNVVKGLINKDSDFSEYLKQKGVDLKNPEPEANIDTIFRKLKPVIAFRYYFKGEKRIRSRKNITLYYGSDYTIELADGNPRLLLSVIEMLAPYMKNDHELDINIQSDIIFNFSQEVYNTYSVHPDNYLFTDQKISTLINLIDLLGKYFFNSIVAGKFNPEPINCFRVDENVPTHILELVKFGLRIGAFQHLEPSLDPLTETIEMKKLRLTYALYPKFRIPKREYSAIKLSKILFDEEELPLFREL
ncbi:MAG: hypothetical protein IPL92_05265 [Saprospiraceae bacterium]|nr:hypothetical protein [Candidatus Opimibacter iunctus]